MLTDFLSQPIGASKWFKWKEALYLRQWDVMVFPDSDSTYLNIIEVAARMDKIRDLINRPIIITSWYRPEKYNTFIKGSFDSSHKYGMGVDFVVPGVGAQWVRDILYHKLVEWNFRMERLPNANWTHIDIRNCDKNLTVPQRYFEP